MSSVVEQIRGYLESELNLDLSGIEPNSPLFTSGLIDSFALIELLAYLESEVGADIDIAELDIEQLDTLEDLANLAKS